MSKNLSGIQQDVLSLYRRILREAMKKDRSEQAMNSRVSFLTLRYSNNAKESQAHGSSTSSTHPAATTTTTYYAINEFRKQAQSVHRNDFKKIDYMIRKGNKYIKLLSIPSVKLVSSTSHAITAKATSASTSVAATGSNSQQ